MESQSCIRTDSPHREACLSVIPAIVIGFTHKWLIFCSASFSYPSVGLYHPLNIMLEEESLNGEKRKNPDVILTNL